MPEGYKGVGRPRKRDYCRRGHLLFGDNLKMTPLGCRRCVACERRRYEEQQQRIAEARAAAGKPLPGDEVALGGPRPTCGRGHALVGANLIERPSGQRECRACRAAWREGRRALGREHWERELGLEVTGDRLCKNGHRLAEAGLYVRPTGERECRACKREALRGARNRV